MGYSIAEAAERLGLTAHTLRYYERDGLMLEPVERSASGQRRYSDQDLEWVTLIARLRSTGMPIREVRRYTELVRLGDATEEERLTLLEGHREAVLARLAEVTDHLGAIDTKIKVYRDKLERRQTVA